jgi:hypothetical protein
MNISLKIFSKNVWFYHRNLSGKKEYLTTKNTKDYTKDTKDYSCYHSVVIQVSFKLSFGGHSVVNIECRESNDNK